MPSVRFSKKDFMGKTPVVPKFYRLKAKEFSEKLSKDGDSTNFWGEFVVVEDGDSTGLEVRHCFNEKALEYGGGAAEYMACFTENTDALENMEVLDALKQTVDHEVQGFLQWDPNFRRNQVKEWRPVKS